MPRDLITELRERAAGAAALHDDVLGLLLSRAALRIVSLERDIKLARDTLTVVALHMRAVVGLCKKGLKL